MSALAALLLSLAGCATKEVTVDGDAELLNGGRTIALGLNVCNPDEITTEVEETATTVTVTVSVANDNENLDCAGQAEVYLDEPLGSRTLIDGTTDEEVEAALYVDPDSQGFASSIPIATSDWTPGDGGNDALVTGELRLSKTDCLHIHSGPHATDVVWPAGYTAERTSPDTVVVKRPDGAIVAQVGLSFSATGGYVPGTGIEFPCRAGDGDVAYINEDMAPLK